MPDLLREESTPPWRIDAQDDSLSRRILTQRTEVTCQVARDTIATERTLCDLPFSEEHLHSIVLIRASLVQRIGLRKEVRQRHHRDIISRGDIETLCDEVLHIETISQGIDEVSTHEGLSLTESTTAISEGAQAIDRYRARSRDLTKHEVPQPVEVDRDLLTIGLTELIEHKGLYSSLISTDLEDMGLDPELIQSLTVEGRCRSQPDKPHHTLRVEDDLVRYR